MTPDTYLEPEEIAYPNGAFARRGRALVTPNEFNPELELPYGQVRSVRASIPDTYFSIPARIRYRGRTIRGFLTMGDSTVCFTPERDAR